ncbi:DUF1735 domain-containing protein [Ascidiimonas aurantiaca]|uniref:DUF1735 domain-containing protein n=1 Tax=Ascidiimonas aurantiaca TaxID=1685432 RepID=UPI0030EB185F
MKKILNKLSVMVIAVLAITSCADNDIEIFDARNGRAIAGFSNPTESPTVIFNPAEDTENTFTIGVSTVSDSDRAVVLEVDLDETTLDESYYSISTLNPVIPAGEFTVDIIVTTFGSDVLPGSSDFIALNLVSVEGAEILAESRSELEIGLDVRCPDVQLDTLPGSYTVTRSTFAAFFGETDFDREVIAGPGENQLTIVGGTYITEGAEDLIITIDPETGAVTAVDETKIASQVFSSPNTYRFQPGGRVLTCVGIIQVSLDFGGSLGGNAHVFHLLKQP